MTEEKIGRRSFLKKSAAIAGGLGLGGLVLRGPIGEAITRMGETEEERFIRKGVGDFLPFYRAISELHHNYYARPQWTVHDSASWDLVAELGWIARGDPGDVVRKRVIEGWGEKEDQAVALAHQKVRIMHIKIDEGLPDTEETVKTAYTRLAEVLPGYVLVAPDTLHVLHGGGFIDMKTYDHYGREKPTEIAIESPAKDLEGFYRSGMHELAHTETAWYELKPYVDKRKFIDYITTETYAIKEVIDTFCNLPWEEAQKINPSGFGIVPEHIALDVATTTGIEGRMRERYKIDVDNLAPLEPNFAESKVHRFNRLVWVLARHRKAVREKEASGINLDDREKRFLIDYDVYRVMKITVGDLHHLFVGPVQREGLGLVGNNFPPENQGSAITELNKKVQLARLKATSTLRETELQTFETSAQALRDRFGL